MNYDYLFKFIVIGDSGVGKSCILLGYTDGRFKDIHETTVGVEFGSKTVKLDEDVVRLQIWDTAGQESFQSITRSYYRGAIACILVYDVTRRSSFTHLTNWHQDAVREGNEFMKFTLVANKTDLEDKRVVSTKEGLDFANEHNMEFIEVSAKMGENIEEAFEVTARNILDGIHRGYIDISMKEKHQVNGIKLGNAKRKEMKTESFGIAPEESSDGSFCCY
jgi:small GTP-binding protein